MADRLIYMQKPDEKHISTLLTEFYSEHWKGKKALLEGAFELGRYLHKLPSYFSINSPKGFKLEVAKDLVPTAFSFGSGDPASTGLFWFYFWPDPNDPNHVAFAKLVQCDKAELCIWVSHWVDEFDKFLKFEERFAARTHSVFADPESKFVGFVPAK